jgi:hypothetical protein
MLAQVPEVPARPIVADEPVPDDPGAQTANILAKIDRYLNEAGSDRSRMLTATIWLSDVSYYDAMNAVWDPWVPEDAAPARACETSAGQGGSCPSSTAVSLPWPLPVAPSEPKSSHFTRAVLASRPSAASRSVNIRAARIGPTVCELLGPMPILKRSKTEMAMTGGSSV